MLDVVILTLFPDMFTGILSASILKRAQENGQLRVQLVNFRQYATDRHRTVDDYPFGGGQGMLLKPDPLFRAVAALQDGLSTDRDRVVLLSAQGRRFDQRVAQDLVQANQRLILICGHYEGVDQRVRDALATDEISMGDFVLTGGEIAAMVVVDAMARLVPGVLGHNMSARDESFTDHLLEYPQYTRPAEFQGLAVPAVLLSGNHQEIERWRRREALRKTWRQRPDLLLQAALAAEERELIRAWDTERQADSRAEE